MTPYYQDSAVTIYHGENKSCGKACGMVDCNHENTYTTNGGRTTSAVPDAKRRQARCASQARTTQRIPAVCRTRSQTRAAGERSSRMERGQCQRKGGTFSRSADVPCATVFCVRQGTVGTSPHRRQHTEQRTGQRSVCMPEVPHGKGRAA
jgi:hypothetical protein